MKKQLLLLAFLISASIINAQDYLDVMKASYHSTTLGNTENDSETDVSNANIEVYFPLPLTSDITMITGFTYENTRLGLINTTEAVDAGFMDRSNLVMTRLNLGVKLEHGKKWSGTYVALPKFASDFNNLGNNDFQMGGLALLEKRYSSKYSLKFGTYISSENFGTTLTPLIGLWYKSKNKKFYINATLPIRADANYSLTDHFSLGANLITSIKSYNLSEFDSNFYVQEESIRFSAFAAYGFLNDALIVRGRVGLDTTDYGVYAEGDTVGLQVLTFQVGGDDRTRLNNEFSAAPFVGIDLIFRTGL
ncbi:DUF6268 family outer membrane beta-barrel protein [uncultured Dokdonia sp.]|uniref:DUF6268 family outer membrane beta-barrel protein n=1 Tax=uncultured Dokdonia sp. TaxID=575653 RepID=UPI002608E7B3|nr:DUF6268 family outer membrane beta-barrel protein [uncultured Dokdonia sp.]